MEFSEFTDHLLPDIRYIAKRIKFILENTSKDEISSDLQEVGRRLELTLGIHEGRTVVELRRR